MEAPDIQEQMNGVDDMKAESSPLKKAKFRPATLNSIGEVAEIVLVLSAFSKIRGGKKPTVVENDMMESAREKLIELCRKIAPNDIVSVDSIGSVIEDLGLNKIREQKRGPMPPRMTIAEKMLHTKRKMEESKGFMTQASKYSSHAVAENMGKSFSVAGSGNDQSPMKNMTWSLQQPQLPSSTKRGLENKLKDPTFSFDRNTTNSFKAGLHRPVDQTGKTFTTTKSASGPLNPKTLQNFNPGYVPSAFNHGEIVKFIQKLGQDRQGERSTWTPPSKDYVNKPLTCQICKLITNEVQTVLICDSCENGFHLQCIQSSIIKGIPRGEWHCFKCVALSNGKPLPPKYGRVMRNMTIIKGPSNDAAVLSSPVKKTMSLEKVVNPHKDTGILDPSISGSTSVELSASNLYASSVQCFPDASTSGSNSVELSSSNRDASDVKEVKGLISNIDEPKENNKMCPDVSFNGSIDCGLLQVVKSNEGTNPGNAIHSEAEYEPLGENSNTVINPGGSQVLITSESGGHNLMPDFEVASKENFVDKSVSGDQTIDRVTKHDEKIMETNVSEMADDGIKSSDKSKVFSDEMIRVDWVGEIVHSIDEKTFYKCCNIDGITYMVNHYAFLSSCNENLAPCKLLAMWEDKTGEKWMNVIMFGFPGDMPKSVELPCPPRSNEVYELKGEHTFLAGKIRGTCHIFGVDKFNEHEGDNCDRGEGDKIHDVFICRWLFDEAKGIFEPIAS